MDYRKITKSNFDLSDFQINALNFLSENSGNLGLNAGPGTGKTEFLRMAAEFFINFGIPPSRITALAFNSDIAEEGNKKLPVHFLTMHSLSNSMLRQTAKWINTSYNLKSSKTYYAAKYFVTNRAEEYDLCFKDNNVKQLFISALSQFLERFQTTYPLVSDITNEQYEIISINTKKIKGENADKAFFMCRDILKLFHSTYDYFGSYKELRLYAESRLKEKTKNTWDKNFLYSINFNEMLFLPMLWGVEPPEIDILLVDEIQDMNGLQIMFIKYLVASRYVLVGDPYQAIYGFAGAFSDSFFRVTEGLNAEILPLSLNYRSLPKILDLARETKPDLIGFRNESDGIVENITESQCLEMAEPGDLIISRFNKDLVKLFIRLISQGKPAKIMGRQSSTILINSIRAATNWGKRNYKDVYSDLAKAKDERILAAMETLDTDAFEGESQLIIDEFELIFSLVESSGAKSYKDLFEYIQEIFLTSDNEERECVLLSTIHKAKGLEFPRVFVLRQDEMPFSFKGQTEEDKEQELHLKLVAETRARDELYCVEMPRGKNES